MTEELSATSFEKLDHLGEGLGCEFAGHDFADAAHDGLVNGTWAPERRTSVVGKRGDVVITPVVAAVVVESERG